MADTPIQMLDKTVEWFSLTVDDMGVKKLIEKGQIAVFFVLELRPNLGKLYLTLS